MMIDNKKKNNDDMKYEYVELLELISWSLEGAEQSYLN